MAALEEDLYEDLAYEEAEGAAALGEFEDEFEDEFQDGFEDEFEEEAFMDEEAYFEDEFDDYEAIDEADEFDEFEDLYTEEEEEDALDSAMAYALAAEDTDESLGNLIRGFKQVAKKVGQAVKRAAPVVGHVARGASRVAKLIPHPYAQAVGRVAGVVGRAAQLAQKLRAEGATEEEAMKAFAEFAVRDKRALPIVAGLTARTVLKNKGARMSFGARKQAVKNMKAAAKNLVRKRGPTAIRALPKIAKSVRRTAAVKGTPAAAATKVVQRTVAKVAKSPRMTRKLSKPSPMAKLMVKKTGMRTRSYTIPGPTRITISAV